MTAVVEIPGLYVDARYLPFFFIRVGGSELHMYDVLEDAIVTMYSTRQRIVTVTDIVTLERPSAASRKRTAELLERTAPLNRQYAIGSVSVVRSRAIRGALTAVSWLKGPENPERFASNLEQAAAMARQLFAGEGLTLEPRVAQFIDDLAQWEGKPV